MSTPPTPHPDSARQRLLAGEILIFNPLLPDHLRTIDGSWVTEAARNGVPVSISGAVISGVLNAKYLAFRAELSFNSCQIKTAADFSFAVFSKRASFAGSGFHFGANFAHCTFQAEVEFAQTQFVNGVANFSAICALASFQASGLKTHASVSAEFPLATFEQSVNFGNATFGGRANFSQARVKGWANIEPVAFRGEANFQGVDINNLGMRRSVFEGEAKFVNSTFGSLHFQGAVFKKATNFNLVTVTGSAFFRAEPNIPAASFEGAVDFRHIHIGRLAEFNEVRFTDKSSRVMFYKSHIGSQAFFNKTSFSGPCSFDSATFGGSAEFNESTFGGSTSFENATITGSAEFIDAAFSSVAKLQGIHFRHSAYFRRTTFTSGAYFGASVFAREAIFSGATFAGEVRFVACRFEGLAHFSRSSVEEEALTGTRFEAKKLPSTAPMPHTPEDRAPVSFRHASFSGDARFENAVFFGPVEFSDTDFRTLRFSDDGTVGDQSQFHSTLDFRGCTYRRLEGSSLCILRFPPRPFWFERYPIGRRLAKTRFGSWWNQHRLGMPRLAPYDRQPYVQMEQAVRLMGRDREADQIHMEQRRVERLRMKPMGGRWLFDSVYKLAARYGIRPYRLIGYAIFWLALGTFVFSREGSHKPVNKTEQSSSWYPAFLPTVRTAAEPRTDFLERVVGRISSFDPNICSCRVDAGASVGTFR